MKIKDRIRRPISDRELNRRWEATRELMKEKDVETLLMQGSNLHLGGYVRWFTDIPAEYNYYMTVLFSVDSDMTLIRSSGSRIPEWALRGVEEVKYAPMAPTLNYTSEIQTGYVIDYIRKHNKKRIGYMGKAYLTAGLITQLQSEFPNLELVDLTDEFDLIKAIKSQEEMELVREAALQNGIGNVDIIKKYVQENHIVYVYTTLTSDRIAPGHIEMTTLQEVDTHLHPISDSIRPRLNEFINLLNDVGLNTTISDDIDEKIWYKLLVNTSENTLCSIFKINVSDLMINTHESYEIAKQIIYEVSDVARAKGINISRQKALEHVMKVTYSVPEYIPSMVLDVINKKNTEIGTLNEAVVKEGESLGVPTPINQVVVNIIRTIEENYGKSIS